MQQTPPQQLFPHKLFHMSLSYLMWLLSLYHFRSGDRGYPCREKAREKGEKCGDRCSRVSHRNLRIKKEKNLLCLWNIHVFWKLIPPSCIHFSFSSYSSFSISVATRPPFHDKMRRQRSARWCLQLHAQNLKGSLWFVRVFEIAEIHVTLHSYFLKKKATSWGFSRTASLRDNFCAREMKQQWILLVALPFLCCLGKVIHRQALDCRN